MDMTFGLDTICPVYEKRNEQKCALKHTVVHAPVNVREQLHQYSVQKGNHWL